MFTGHVRSKLSQGQHPSGIKCKCYEVVSLTLRKIPEISAAESQPTFPPDSSLVKRHRESFTIMPC